MRLFVRLSLIGLVALVAFGFWYNQSQPNQANQEVVVQQGQCQAAGISLVIDFGSDSNQQIIEKCLQNYSGNSWNLLKAAGLNIEGTQKYPVGFLCRINGFPSEESEKCIDTPGAKTGSWAFYTSTSTSWEYSAIGAASHKAECGTAEGWRFLLPTEELTEVPSAKPQTNNCEN